MSVSASAPVLKVSLTELSEPEGLLKCDAMSRLDKPSAAAVLGQFFWAHEPSKAVEPADQVS